MEMYSDQIGYEGAATAPWHQPSVLDQIAVGIYSLDSNGRCTQINAAALEMLGYTEVECLHQDMHALIHYKRADGTPYPAEDCPLYRARFSGEAVYNMEETLWSKSGAPIHAACSSVPILADSGPRGTIITINDVGARRGAELRLLRAEHEQRETLRQRDATARIELDLAAEEALRQRAASAILERVAAEQLREQSRVSEERLVQAEKLAAVGRLAASISHEINNPLEAVTNLLFLIRNDHSLSAESGEYVRLAESELRRVTEIVAQTLRFQRANAAPSVCQPEALIESVLALHQGRLHHSSLNIDRQHRRVNSILCAEGDIRQILNNLVGNAIDAMKETGGTLILRTQPAFCPRTGRAGLRISVADSGHGMSPATAAKVFEPFYTTKGAGGSGLGLWISHSLASRNGGRLSVRSRTGEKNHGTVFSLFMPSANEVAAA